MDEAEGDAESASNSVPESGIVEQERFKIRSPGGQRICIFKYGK